MWFAALLVIFLIVVVLASYNEYRNSRHWNDDDGEELQHLPSDGHEPHGREVK